VLSAKVALLQVLSIEPGYGSDLAERIKKLTDGKIVFGAGSVYPAIREMEKEGLIVQSETKGRSSLYKITASGKKEAELNKKSILALFVTT
jgi:PadR family transcriptional regulator, regulatory protein PadR